MNFFRRTRKPGLGPSSTSVENRVEGDPFRVGDIVERKWLGERDSYQMFVVTRIYYNPDLEVQVELKEITGLPFMHAAKGLRRKKW